MTCKLEEMDCVDIAYAGHVLTDYSNEIQKRIINMKSSKYKEEHLIEGEELQLEGVTAARKDLLKVANRCGCNIDLTTGMIG